MSVKVKYHDYSDLQAHHVHGHHAKDQAVLHETVSKDIPGFADITGIETYLASIDYGIHGVNDKEGNIGWALGLGDAIFYQAGGVNERSIGIEQVSDIPTLLQNHTYTLEQARNAWHGRHKQLQSSGQLLAAWHNVDPSNRPLVYSDGLHPGVTTHWDVSQHFSASLGHTDCHPAHKGGYYPVLEVIGFAKIYANLGYHF